jgi:hypothetical protein
LTGGRLTRVHSRSIVETSALSTRASPLHSAKPADRRPKPRRHPYRRSARGPIDHRSPIAAGTPYGGRC